jgi:hypothetical protein
MNDIYEKEAVVYWIHLKEHTDIFNQGYIGVSTKFKDRARRHKNKLLKNKHENKHLQNACDLYDIRNLIWDIVLISKEDYCYKIENKLRPNKNIGWNLEKGGIKAPDTTGRVLTDGHKEKLSKSLRGRPTSIETREKLSNSLMGHNVSDEQILKYKNSRSKNLKSHYIIIFPDQHEELITSLNDFCKQYNLSYRAFSHILEGAQKQHKGFRIRYAYPELH